MASVVARLQVKLIDRMEASKVLFDPDIYDRATDDHSPPMHDFEMPDIEYMGGYVDGDLASLNIEHPFQDGTKIHFNVLKPYRWAARELLDLTLEGINPPIYAEIPECFKSTINFAKNAGFKVMRVKQRAYLKNGELHDRYLMVRQ